jgi:pimeloyl-ACP methyl ester carboxylesterase
VTQPPGLHIDIEGDGPTVLLMHGFGGSARNFGPQARALRDRYRVVRFDARGHGRSAAPDDPREYAPAAFVADVGRVLDIAGAPTAVVGGLSMGAGIALRFALAHPERVRGLVLAAFPGGPDGPGFAGIAEELAFAIERDGLDAAGAAHVWGPTSRLDPRAAALVRRGFLEHRPEALVHTLRELIAHQQTAAELAPATETLAMPGLVIVGANDRTALASSRAVAAALPDARLVEIPGAGHIVNLSHAQPFNRALLDFLREIEAPARRR